MVSAKRAVFLDLFKLILYKRQLHDDSLGLFYR